MIYFAPAIYKHCPVCGSYAGDGRDGPKLIKSSDYQKTLISIGSVESKTTLVCCLKCLPGCVIQVLSHGSQHWGPK